MLMHTDRVRDLETLFSRLSNREPNSSAMMPMDAFRRGNDVWLHIDLPGVEAQSIDISIERNTLSIAAARDWQRRDGDQPYVAERYRGSIRRQIELGGGLDLQHLEADLHDGVLTIRIPVAEQIKPRKIQVAQKQPSEATPVITSPAADGS